MLDESLLYDKTHEWVRRDGAAVVIGISDHAQMSLGDIVYVELPKEGTVLKRGGVFGVAESVKAASDLYAPVSGTVKAVNVDLNASPELVNRDCYGSGWLIRLEPFEASDLDELLDSASYSRLVGGA